MATNRQAIEAELAATTAPLEAQMKNLQLDYEAAQRKQAEQNAQRLNELYIAHEQNKRTLPQQNAALGNTGGLTESSIIDLANTYQRNRNAQNQTYTDAIGDLTLEYNKNRNTIAAQLAAAQAAANAKLAALQYSGGTKKVASEPEKETESTPAPNAQNWSGYGEFLKLKALEEAQKQKKLNDFVYSAVGAMYGVQ